MSQIFDLITKALGENGIDSIAKQIGASNGETQSAINQALPMMISSLSRQPNTSSGWAMLSSFLDKNNDGSVLDDLLGMALGKSGAAGQSGTTNTNPAANTNALNQILGNARPAVEQHVQNSSGLSADKISALLPLLAPMVVGALAKLQKTNNLNEQSLGKMLEVERSAVAQKAPEATGILNSLLDQNKDGSIADDLARAGTGLLKNFLK